MKPSDTTRRLLITAGPTYEPIDAVRFIGNRSSGRVGCLLADEAASQGWRVTLLLGPNTVRPSHPDVRVIGFQSTADLQTLLQTHMDQTDALIMAAAVADFRPAVGTVDLDSKTNRSTAGLTIELEPTPDLLAGCSKGARSDQLLVGFALEPRATMLESASRKLTKKNIDLIVANPLETMDSDTIEATLLGNPERGILLDGHPQVNTTKAQFAAWLIRAITPITDQRTQTPTEPNPHG